MILTSEKDMGIVKLFWLRSNVHIKLGDLVVEKGHPNDPIRPYFPEDCKSYSSSVQFQHFRSRLHIPTTTIKGQSGTDRFVKVYHVAIWEVPQLPPRLLEIVATHCCRFPWKLTKLEVRYGLRLIPVDELPKLQDPSLRQSIGNPIISTAPAKL